MKFIDIKKIFSASLAVSTLISANASANGNVNNFHAAPNVGNRWDKEKVKYVAKKSAPYVVVMVPSAAVLTYLVVLAVKHGKGNGEQSQQPGTSSSTQTGVPSGQCSKPNSSSTSRQSTPPSPCTPQEVSDAIKKCELPGIKFWVVKASWFKAQKSDYYFYTITDLALARRYFASLGDKAEEQKIVEWQNHSIYEKDVDSIFGNSAKFRAHFDQIIKQKQELMKVSKYEGDGTPHQIAQSGMPVIKAGMEYFDVMASASNQVACVHISKNLNVPAAAPAPATVTLSAPVAVPQGSGSTSAKPATTVVSQIPEKKPEKDSKKDSEDVNDGARNSQLAQEILFSGAAVGATALDEAKKTHENNISEQLAKGCLPGFKFYRYVPGFPYSTRHCYIITDYNAAKTSLGVSDENDIAWKKVVLYQNRWLDKKRGRNSGWSFESLFGFDDGTFGGYFNKITKVNENMRQGSETLESLPVGCNDYNFGRRVFGQGDAHLGGHSAEILNIICPVSEGSTTVEVLDQQVEKFRD